MGIRKFMECDGFGRATGRLACVIASARLPEPTAGCRWQQDDTFDEAAELRSATGFDMVVRQVRERGYAVID